MKAPSVDRSIAPTSTGITNKMDAIVQDAYGSDARKLLRLAEVVRPAIQDDQVLVRVAAASVDRGTVHVMTGMPYAMRLAGFGARAPKAANPGRCFAGTIDSVGKQVTGFAPGDQVYGTSTGTFAEYVAAKPGKVALKPANLTFGQAAAVPISAVTALQAVRRAGVGAADKVLVIGASGGVGSFAVQIAKAFGAEVTGVASTSKVEMVRALGAQHVVDYTAGDFLDGRVRYDLILDTGGNSRLADLRRALTPTGRLVLVGGESGARWLGMGRQLKAALLSPLVKQKLGSLMSKENAEDLVVLTELIESGRVVPAVDKTYPLAEAAAAITYVWEGRARGKVVIAI
ncbi:MAG TPA: NAD(P)-dependent alcohol dehydrogenase [Actinomycetota bacterium]|nr:NAD(P)-dependent alcohol dehydrogenase [Actinomycetota bacterium]